MGRMLRVAMQVVSDVQYKVTDRLSSNLWGMKPIGLAFCWFCTPAKPAWHDGYVRHPHNDNDCIRLTIRHGASDIDFWCVAYITDPSAYQTHPAVHAYSIENASTTNKSIAQQKTTNQSRTHSRYLKSWKIISKQGIALHNVTQHRAHHIKT
jgi:hypothetical protein